MESSRDFCSTQDNNKLYVAGIGPGGMGYLCRRAVEVLQQADTIAGYTTYIDLIKPLIKEKNIIQTAMKKEVERVEAAIDTALSGRSCVIVSSGDPGIYAMAGLVFEMCRKKNIAVTADCKTDKHALQIEIIPGIPALASGASLLGAPLTHDFAAISLSDLLTPWELIEKRINAAAEADFVIVIYNPKSKKRSGHLEKAQKIILKYRDKNTPAGIVTGAMRENQHIQLTTLENLHTAEVDMQTTVFIGNSTTFDYQGFMVTPRGYARKYNL
ncbi:Precorrin-3B C(17)-methyltransferase [Desulfonema limicola]|uniref:Precorrin-3B C(17)-methyltransferase n=1 Tax=Desulfonema limicola TaxID=45656 RepID=A0A975BCX7_9BACT|nr:precorrin-3B C(17)-methyltransferase [Desulfonema limicola]QTA83071.1 Precorrin-3B C(17)-methyltransferase [Desulfonema limicola]